MPPPGAGAGPAPLAPVLTPRALQLLSMLGLHVHRDIRLFTKVCILAGVG